MWCSLNKLGASDTAKRGYVFLYPPPPFPCMPHTRLTHPLGLESMPCLLHTCFDIVKLWDPGRHQINKVEYLANLFMRLYTSEDVSTFGGLTHSYWGSTWMIKQLHLSTEWIQPPDLKATIPLQFNKITKVPGELDNWASDLRMRVEILT